MQVKVPWSLFPGKGKRRLSASSSSQDHFSWSSTTRIPPKQWTLWCPVTEERMIASLLQDRDVPSRAEWGHIIIYCELLLPVWTPNPPSLHFSSFRNLTTLAQQKIVTTCQKNREGLFLCLEKLKTFKTSQCRGHLAVYGPDHLLSSVVMNRIQELCALPNPLEATKRNQYAVCGWRSLTSQPDDAEGLGNTL